LVTPRTWAVAQVADVTDVTPNARVLGVVVPGWPGNLPGQHVDVRLTAEDGYQAVRSYSLGSSGAGERIELAVDEHPEGEVSPYLVRDAQPGDHVEVLGPLGGYFVWHDEDASPVQLIAGGSGIVPLRAIARARVDAGTNQRFRLLYSVKSPEDAIYRDDLMALGEQGIELTWAFTQHAPEGWPGVVGRLNAESIASAVLPVTDAPTVYVCGPTAFVEVVARALVGLGHDPARIKTERFGGG
jgi:ferredoxin-NADP reductase